MDFPFGNQGHFREAPVGKGASASKGKGRGATRVGGIEGDRLREREAERRKP